MAEEVIFSFVLETIRDLLIHEARFLIGVEDQVEKLDSQLNHMHWFLRDTASANQDAQKRVLEWVLQVRNLAYEAENLIETYALKVASRRRGGIRGKLKRFAGLLNECYQRHKVGADIETLLNKISDLTTSFHEYGIRQIIMENKDSNGASRRPILGRTYSIANDEDYLFVGSEDTTTLLAKKLVSDKYRTVSLHGMGGLGKTTIARKLYHHPIVKDHFEGFSWVSISQQWQKEDVLRGILIKLMPNQNRDEIQKWRDEELVRKLSEFLLARKCLLVLDDVWTTDAWESIKHALPIREDGSKVLMTTRNEEVAKFMDGHGYMCNPPLLSVDESWELLRKKALRGQDSQRIIDLEQIGKEMVAQCGGLPLAVVALGGILSSKRNYDEWQNVGDNIKSYLRKDSNTSQGQRGVQSILALSYDDLPFQLKPCFLYLSQYAEDAEIEAETLCQYWMAEGMVSAEDRIGRNETMMDVAEHYLNELGERSMVFVKKEEEHSHRRFKSCRLHDLMRDMCISKVKEEKFLESVDFGNVPDGDEVSSVSRMTSRLPIHFPLESDSNRFVPPGEAVSRSLRSFTLVLGFSYGQQRTFLEFNEFKFSEFVMIRNLSLEGFEFRGDRKFPSSIGKLVHLRYLSLKSTTFEIMPSSIIHLEKLQTLHLGDTDGEMLNAVWKLPQLKHLYLPVSDKYGYSFYGLHFALDRSQKLEILEGFHSMFCNANHLSTLTSLRKLTAFVEDKLEDLEVFINQVRKLTHLRVLGLKISYISCLSSEKGLAIINKTLSCSNLVNLTIWGELSKLPEYDSGLCRNLQSLTLWDCCIEEDPLSTLERLPNLKRLHLIDNAFSGKEMTCHAFGFPELRFLKFGGLFNLEKWEIEDGAMPNLSKLSIDQCHRLEMIPPGLRFLNLLKKLEVGGMPEEFNTRVRVEDDGQEGADFDKVRHVQTIKID